MAVKVNHKIGEARLLKEIKNMNNSKSKMFLKVKTSRFLYILMVWTAGLPFTTAIPRIARNTLFCLIASLSMYASWAAPRIQYGETYALQQ